MLPRCNPGLFGRAKCTPDMCYLKAVDRSRPRLYDEALATLFHLHILANSAVKLTLNATFKTSFRQAITGG